MSKNTYIVYDLIKNTKNILSEDSIKSYYNNLDSFCFGYARQSTSYQNSIEEQIYHIKRKAKEKNFKNIIMFTCIGSGWNVNNLSKLSDFKKMTRIIPYFHIRYNSITIFIYDVSRFMRNVLIATEFINKIFDPFNCTIHSIIDNKIWDKNNNNRIDFLRELIEAEAHSVLLSNKMKNNIKNRRNLGHHIGGTKFGYEKYRDHNLIMKVRKNNREQNILGYIKKKYNKEKFSKKNKKIFESICDVLNSQGLYKRSKEWNYKMIDRIVKSKELDKVENCDLEISNNNFRNWIQCDTCDKWRCLNSTYYDMWKSKILFECENIPCLNCNIPEESYQGDDEMDVTMNHLNISNDISNEIKNLMI